MERRLAALLLATAALVFAAGCGEDDAEEGLDGDPAVKTKSFDDPKELISVAANSSFEIVLDSNPSTGYSWKFVGAPGDKIIDYIGTEYLPDKTKAGVAGAGGEDTLTFRATGAGKATIKLEYVGPGRKPDVGEQRSIPVTATG